MHRTSSNGHCSKAPNRRIINLRLGAFIVKRKWTNIQGMEWRIVELRKAGKTRQEIADELGIKKVQIKNWINRYNKETARNEAGVALKRRGRPSKNDVPTGKEKDFIIKRLKMENELLRDFLRADGRK